MAKYLVRIDKETRKRLEQLRNSIEGDIKNYTGKRKKVSFGKVIKFAVLPRYNENFIQLDLGKVSKELRRIRSNASY